jgi:hypothetical protein
MKVAFGHIHYTPDVFWGMSLREWQATLKGYIQKKYGEPEVPMTSSRLHKLMEEYPDDRPTN